MRDKGSTDEDSMKFRLASERLSLATGISALRQDSLMRDFLLRRYFYVLAPVRRKWTA